MNIYLKNALFLKYFIDPGFFPHPIYKALLKSTFIRKLRQQWNSHCYKINI